jgi:hypothetical protein
VCVFSLWQQQHQATSSSSFFFSFFLLLTPCRVIERPFWSFFFPVAIIFAVQTFFSSFLWRVLSCRFIRPRSAARLFYVARFCRHSIRFHLWFSAQPPARFVSVCHPAGFWDDDFTAFRFIQQHHI